MTARISSYLTLASCAALAQGLLLLISPIVTRLYGPEDVGGYAMVLGVGALFGSVGTGRLEHAIPVARGSIDAIRVGLLGLTMAVGTALLISLAIWVVPLPESLAHTNWQRLPLVAVPAIAVSLAFSQLVNALLLRRRAFRSVGVNKLFQGGVTGLFQLLLGWAAWGELGLIWAQALGYLAGGASGVRRLSRRVWVVSRRYGVELRSTFWRYRRFPLLLAPAALFNLAAQHFPVLALGYLYGLYEAGLYALVMRVCGAPLGLLGQAVAQVYASDFRAYRAGRDGGLARQYSAMLFRLLAIGIGVVACLVIVLNLWGPALFGERWANIGTVASMVSLMLVTDFATTPISMTMSYLRFERVQLAWDAGRLFLIVAVFVVARIYALRFGQLLVLLSAAWSLSVLVHAWLTYRACQLDCARQDPPNPDPQA